MMICEIVRNSTGRIMLLGAVVVLGCCSSALAQSAKAVADSAAWGKPVFVDDFERAQLGAENWEVPKGSCEIRDGKLVVTSEGNFYLFYKRKHASNMAIEFDGMIPDTQKACDLAAILSANEFEPAIRHYQGAVGTKGNKYSAIHRGKVRTEGDEVVARSQLTLTSGKRYHIRAERQDEFVRLFVDGEKVLEYRDPLAFAPASHNRIGLYTYGALTHFDNVKIYTCPVSAQYRKDEAAKWDRVYEEFNQWCIDRLGAEKEPLVYEKYGKELKFVEDGSWRHVSENSACIAWETNLPAKSYIEYGETDRYGQRTPQEERHFYLHIHHLKDLETGKMYHYRVVSVDERGNQITGPDVTFQTNKTPDAVYIPGDMAGPPYTLDKAGATYVLTGDIVADSTALRITAQNVTLDLNGHTVTFNDKFGAAEAVPSTKNIRRAFHGFTGAPGIVGVRGSDGAKLFNGFIVQGRGGSGNVCDPILGVRATEIAGVALDYYGYQMNGFIWAGRVDELHHNVVKDKGTELVDRHWAVSAVTRCKKIHHNLVKRCRQRGVSGGDEITHNEIYQDSYATNSLGISGKNLRGNRILGGGVHICAISWTPGMQVIGNLVHLQPEKTKTVRWSEYGSGRARGSSCNGIRLTQYGSGNTESSNPLYLNNLYSDNLILVSSKDGCGGRGVQFSSHLQTKNLICKDSIIKVVGQDDKSGGTCVVTQGRTAANAQPLYYRNCTFIGSRCIVRFGDGYSIGSNHHFENCKFERVGTNPDFHTFALNRGWSDRHVFLDCEFGPGTKYNDVSWDGAQPQAYYSVAWTLTVKTAPGAKVRIRDKKGAEVFSGTADADGKVRAPLTQCIIRPRTGKPDSANQIVKYDSHLEEVLTPHTVTVEKNGSKAEKQVTADKKQEIEIHP